VGGRASNGTRSGAVPGITTDHEAHSAWNDRLADQPNRAGLHWALPAPVQVGKRWVAERTHAWMNGYGKLRRCTDRSGKVVDFFLYLAAAFVTVRALIREARTRYRWPTRPTTRRLK
jgi:hypothetical protein